MLKFSCSSYYAGSTLGVVLSNRTAKMGFREKFGYTLGLEYSAEVFADGKWDSRNLRHVVRL